MNSAALDQTILQLPEALRRSEFRLLQESIYDCPDTCVFVNQEDDFAFLHPRPEVVDYVRYEPRVSRLKLAQYKKSLVTVQRRLEKIRSEFEDAESVLEIGAGDASFLSELRSHYPRMELASQEVDQNSRAARDEVAGLLQFEHFDEVRASGKKFQIVCMFHVLEHVAEPVDFLRQAAGCLAPGGHIIIEVPSLSDPLLSLYGCEAYSRFYFQRQHPTVYSAASLTRLLAKGGFELERSIDHQRYGLENHLQWLSAGKPGGSEALRKIFAPNEEEYLRSLESSGYTDSFIAVVKPRESGA